MLLFQVLMIISNTTMCLALLAPHMHAEMLERLEPYLKPGNKVLDVGRFVEYISAIYVQPNSTSTYITFAQVFCILYQQ